jgi:hypothetical protein
MLLRSIMESCLIFFISTVAIGLYVLLSSVTNLSWAHHSSPCHHSKNLRVAGL